MPTRMRSSWKRRADDQFDCRVGWKRTSGGRRDQPKFRLGHDLPEAKRRDGLLRQMWEQVEKLQPRDAVWTEDTLEIAKRVARGETKFVMPRRVGEEVVPYSQRVHQLRKLFPMLAIVPVAEYGCVFGVQILGAVDKMSQHAEQSQAKEDEENRKVFLEILQDGSLPQSGPTLHQALRAHVEWIKEEFRDPVSEVTLWGRTQIKQIGSLISHHKNLPLAKLDYDAVEGMIRYWRHRPKQKRTKETIAKKSSENHISAMRRFFKWLHTAPSYDWRRPEGFDDIKTRVKSIHGDRRPQVMPDSLFSLDELTLLYKYATPLERFLLLVGLNCGFGRAEIGSMRVGEVFLRQAHDKHYREILNFESTDQDSFIKRVRGKNQVYGEYMLFPHTVTGIEWALKRRKQQPDFDNEARLLLSDKGRAYDKPTNRGNANGQIPSRFTSLIKRVADDENEIRKLSFGKIRKTAGNLIRQVSDGEVSGVFLCHGNPVDSDDLADFYTARPLGRVFHAIRKVEKILQPMFAAAPNPFEDQPRACTSRKSVDRIIELHREGTAPLAIADEVGRSVATVQRHITRATGPRRRGRPRKAR